MRQPDDMYIVVVVKVTPPSVIRTFHAEKPKFFFRKKGIKLTVYVTVKRRQIPHPFCTSKLLGNEFLSNWFVLGGRLCDPKD